ncbi:MAG: pentapeptide repeat-containing protein [Lachnospiraceae bacterium]|nr:pentapeptide repeat-containing protein [Lachnospiraceae bacterium]
MDKMEVMIGDIPRRLSFVVSLDDIDKDSFSTGLQKEEFKEIASDLKKIGIELKIDSGHLVLGYHKGKEGIINWDDYPIRVPEEKVRSVDMKGAGKVEQEMNKEEILNQDKEFKYQLLDRMRSDCEYYLSYGNKDAKYLWAGNEKEQIETMRAIYNSFSQNEKPEWITLEQIDGFEKEMVEMTREQVINMNEIQIEIEPDVEKRLQEAYNKMSEEDKNAGLLPEELGIQVDYRDLNGDYIEDRFDPDYYDEDAEFNYSEKIKELKNEIMKLEDSIEDTNVCMQMGTEAVTLVKEKIKDIYIQLMDEAIFLLENVVYETRNNPDFLESINVDKINGVYVQKTYSCGAWIASVEMDDILKMREKNGLNSLEFKNCDIRSSVFSDSFENCKFEKCNLFSCELTNVKFTNTTFQNVTFYQCVAQNIEFENCKFEKCYDDVPVVQTLKSENIKFVNTDIKDSRLNLECADTNLDLKSVNLKNCSLENVDCYLTADGKYINQSITKKVNSEQTLMKLLGRDLRKSLNKNVKSQEQPKDKKARIRRKGKSR